MTESTLIGKVPSTPMTNQQKRAHRALARAEKRLIHTLVWEEGEPAVLAAERSVARATTAWKRACDR